MFYLHSNIKTELDKLPSVEMHGKKFYAYNPLTAVFAAYDVGNSGKLDYLVNTYASTHDGDSNCKPVNVQINFFDDYSHKGYTNIHFMQGAKHFNKGITLNGIPLNGISLKETENSNLSLTVFYARNELEKQLDKVRQEYCKQTGTEPVYMLSSMLSEYDNEWLFHFNVTVSGTWKAGARCSGLMEAFIDELLPKQGLWRHPNLPEIFNTKSLDKVIDYPTHWCVGVHHLFEPTECSNVSASN